MSLHTLASHLQSAGRGEDKVLVHMTPNEVSGLQSLAMAHGGSLTINPHTGLPEAGFLSGILPMVAGAALAATGVGAPMAALMVGGAGAAATGSLSKGLMMGLGAYGGAGLGAGLLGGAEAATTGVANISPAISSTETALRSGQLIGGGIAPSAAAVTPTVPVGLQATGAFPTPATTIPTPTANALGVQPQYGQSALQTAPPVVSTAPPAPPVSAPSVESATSMFDKLKSIPTKAFDLLSATGPEADKAREDFYEKNKKYLLAGGIGSLMSGREEQKAPRESSNYQSFNPTWNRMMQSGGNYQPSSYTGSSERRYFADGGIANLPVEHMSQQASTGENTNYPMANLRPYGYAVPRNVPISENVFKPADYERTDPYTGEAKFAGGGLASLVSMATGGFVSKLKPVAEPKKVTPKLQNTAKLEKQVSDLQKYSSLDDAQNRINDINNQLKGLNKKSSDYKTTSEQLNKDLKIAQTDLKNYNAYKTAASKLDTAKSANDAATNKANQQYEDAMSKFNEYKNKLDEEKKTWQEETGRKATGLQAVKPLTTTTAAVPEKEGTFTPKYTKVDGKLVETSSLPPKTEFQKYTKVPGYDATKKIIEPEDVVAVFQDVAGRRPTQQELNALVGTQNSQAAIAKYATNLADVKARVKYEDADLKENFQYYIGRQPTAGELSNMRNQVNAGKITNFNQLRSYIQSRPAYLENINQVAQASFTDQQKQAQQKAVEAAAAAASLAPEDVATAYKDALGRTPTMDELKQYMGAHQTTEGLAQQLKSSDEYLKSLTKPTVPTPTVAPPIVSTPKYAPGTVLEYTPTQQAATGLGAITGGISPATGMQAPLTRGAVTLEGALPLAPNFQEQLGIQNLATAAAEKAPALQTGLQFAAPAQTGYTQSLDSLLAALRAQQAQQAPIGMASGGMADGGYNLGGYSDGGRLLKGPGDGVSDSIPASIGDKQPARLADGEFVIPARIVSEIGNGSTDAGARKLYAMMDRVQRARRKTVGSGNVAVRSGADKMLPV